MLVEIDIEVLKLGDLTALDTAQLIVSQINKQTKQLLLLVLGGGTNQAFELLNGLDVIDIQSSNQIILRRIDTTAVQVTSQ